MDPNAALNEIRRLTNNISSEIDLEEGHPFELAKFLGDMSDLINHVNGLDEWMSKGGHLPKGWQRNDSAPADLVGNLLTRLEGLQRHFHEGLISRFFVQEQIQLAINEAKQLDIDPAPVACLHPTYTRSVGSKCTEASCHNYYKA